MGWWSKSTGLLRFACDVRPLLRRRVDDASAAATIACGTAERERRFLAMLDAKHGDPFAALYADLRGDALSAAGRAADARAAYQLAYSKFDEKSPYRSYVQVKLESLGGAPAAQGTGSAAIALPPAGGAPAAAAPAPSPAAPSSAAPAPAAPKK